MVPVRRVVRPELQFAVAGDVLDRNGLKGKDELVLTTEFDASRFAHLSDEELRQLITLGRKVSVQRDARDGES